MSPDRSNDAWSFDLGGGGWDSIPVTPPPPRYGHAAMFDPITESMIVFGGVASTPRFDVWKLSLDDDPRWAPVSGPVPAMDTPATIHDPVRNRMVVFGTGTDLVPVAAALNLHTGRSWEFSDPRQPLRLRVAATRRSMTRVATA